MGNKAKNKGKRSAGSSRAPHGFKHAKSLGQNFLNDQNVIYDIVEGSEIDEETLVIEIGPGEGALTTELVEVAGHVIAIELDDRLIPILCTKFALHDNFELIHEDVLKVDIKSMVSEIMAERGLTKTRIVGNLPYYITTPIITKLIESEADFESLTVMMQKEVGDRIEAEPGTKLAGAITYAVHYRCTVDKLCDVSRESFYPVPKVDSVVLRLNMRDVLAVHVNDENNFFRCIKAGFSMRRKTLLNSLQALDDVNKDIIKRALENANIDPSRRAETLTMEEFAELSNSIWEE
ncbi:16S rRNA (adenine(1518)-N(6)/adenine(1519)-N(6))-dimethyltransferase RsmA [Mogibacterium pumilum]|uniref:Ribosomal RNA small subunit methyltransferase A n=1 Tax=Mogibacterium pumilum TaxID=86332 RepID=A0A223AQP4_9FIRM|nr:16S rRNA (adenine(1518)-N(6)/adenine(1519)-N(6))-dimethyltransferase RsmA [Mogibacterium pumilum]ASS37277.1 16S rRNA (adenine(1518)-N(6)/adenine(1519)-N(6))-dimethyltransferase [Mogibacterium pumilum]